MHRYVICQDHVNRCLFVPAIAVLISDKDEDLLSSGAETVALDREPNRCKTRLNPSTGTQERNPRLELAGTCSEPTANDPRIPVVRSLPELHESKTIINVTGR